MADVQGPPKSPRRAATVHDSGLAEDHVAAMRGLMSGHDPEGEARSAAISRSPDPARYASLLKEAGGFTGGTPQVITSWALKDTAAIDLQSTVHMMMMGTRPGAQGLDEMADIGRAAAWVPHAHSDGMRDSTVPEGDPHYIASRNLQSGYAIVRAIAKGGYGTVYDAFKIDPRNFRARIPSSRVAIKFVEIRAMRTGLADAEVVSPGSVAGMFVNYAVQRSYGGCMPFTVCMRDIFLYARPRDASSDDPEMQWYVAIVMERMDGHIGHLVNTPEFRKTVPGQPSFFTRRVKEVALLMSKCCRAVYDLELLRIWHNDIKPSNFLWKGGEGVVQVTDFDISVFAQHVARGRGEGYEDMRAAFIKGRTDGGVDVGQEPWASDRLTADMLENQLRTTEDYEPPEYHKIAGLLAPGSALQAHEKARLRSHTVHRAEWWSRMMLYQLVATFRELCLETGLNQPHYIPYARSKATGRIEAPPAGDEQFVGTYVRDITLPNAAVGSNRDGSKCFAYQFNQMRMRPGKGCIAPCPAGTPFAARLEAWKRIRANTINVGFLEREGPRKEVVDFVLWFNRTVANVIAPRMPEERTGTPADENVYYPLLHPAVPYCVPADDGATMSSVRPSVGTFMSDLTRHLNRCGWLPLDPRDAGARIPSNIDELARK